MSLTWTFLVLGLGGGGVAAAVGTALARSAQRKSAQKQAADLTRNRAGEARALLASAELDAQQERRGAEVEARQAALAWRAELDVEQQARQAELGRREAQVAREEARIERVEGELATRTGGLDTRQKQMADIDARVKAARTGASSLVTEAVALIERQAGQTQAAARSRIIEALVEEVQSDAGAQLRQIESNLTVFERDAKKIMSTAIDRYAGDYGHERMSSQVPMPPQAVQRLVGKEPGRLDTLAELIGIKLSVADSGEAIFIEGLDGVAREVARRTLTIAANMSRAFPENPKGLIGDISGRLSAEIDELGVRAFKELEIPTSHAEINRLVGRLRYRTSYTQNQWQHAIEVGFLCGLLADEMGEDRSAARRAGLLHDIGKAVSHEMDGSHAVIGGDYARRLGEREEIANAIAAHHADEPCNSVLAHLTAASDALSGGRPGARREIVETYGSRIEDLEAIAHETGGVQRAFALQAGRELRVFVDGQKVSDLQARDISLSIARRVEDELVYPGQIRVTVIRQMRSEAVAR